MTQKFIFQVSSLKCMPKSDSYLLFSLYSFSPTTNTHSKLATATPSMSCNNHKGFFLTQLLTHVASNRKFTAKNSDFHQKPQAIKDHKSKKD